MKPQSWTARYPKSMLLCSSLLLGLSAQIPDAAAQQRVQLGPAPQWQPDAAQEHPPQPWPQALPSSGDRAVSFDPMNRAEVVQAYRQFYLAQAQVPMGWNGNVAACNADATTVQHHQAVIDRVNYYRAHAGLPGTVQRYGGAEAIGTQKAALMFSANRQLSHDPPSDWACFSNEGKTAAGKSNIAVGYGSNAAAGVEAVDLYMDDGGAGNAAVGHRRWILYPPQARMDSGSIPNGAAHWAANALWVIGGFGARPATPQGVAWPPRGYVPWQLLPAGSGRWSFSWPGADFSRASIAMKRNGAALPPPSKETLASGYGDNTLVWIPAGVEYSQPSADVRYQVTISGLSGGGVPASISYEVIVIDPQGAPPPAPAAIFANGFEPGA